MENNSHNTENIKNRYIYAVTRHLPVKIQADVKMELYSLISEMVEEKRTGNVPTEQNIKDVLTELGTPEELALKYHGGERKALISGVYFLMYKRVLCTVLPIIALVIAILTTIGFFVGDEATQISLIIGNLGGVDFGLAMQIIVTTIGLVVQTFALITIIFAILDYKKVNLNDGDFYNLPEIPESKQKISPLGPIFGIAFIISTTALFFGFPQIIQFRFNNGWIPVFNTEIIRGLWLPILLWTIVEIVAEVMKLIEGRYTIRLAVVTVVTGILQAVFAIIIFGTSNIVNPELANHIGNLGIDFAPITWVFDNIVMQPNLTLIVIMLAVIFFETLDVLVKVFKERHR
ncbi:MAG: hypothetical protein FWD82_11040 [Defluviitaleaceae bacterium]|nr:hypothetical protein [Defluviitaleaceae bacterium]